MYNFFFNINVEQLDNVSYWDKVGQVIMSVIALVGV